MDDDLRIERSRTFGGAADVYARSRPTYPDDAVAWLTGPGPVRVLELGAGTGKLTASLARAGHDLVASEPSRPMLSQLAENTDVRCVQGKAENLPFRAGTFDVVIVGQAYHWFDAEQAVPEIARVLRHGGAVALVWNFRDEKLPWVRKLGEIIGAEGFGAQQPNGLKWLTGGPLGRSGLFGPIEQKDFGFWQELDREGLLGLVESRSYIIALPQEERKQVLAKVADLYDSYGRGHDGMRLRYVTECYRAAVVKDSRSSRTIEPPGGGDLFFDFG